MTKNLAPMRLATRISLINFAFVALVFGAFIMAITHATTGLVESLANDNLVRQTKVVASLLDASDRDMRQRITVLAKVLRSSLDGEFLLDPTLVDISGRAAPSLKLEGRQLGMDFTIVDRFTTSTGAVATVFAKSGDDFVRVTTSLKNEKGQRALGTLLDRAHPGYKATLEGGSYVGLASLFGRKYMTHYEPIKDRTGKLVGLLFVGLDFTENLAEVMATIKSMKIGQTGYFYILDSKDGPTYGNMVLHPTAEGRNMLDSKDAEGSSIFRTILEQKNGLIRYPSIKSESGENGEGERIAAFDFLKGWNWVLCGGVYVDDFTTEIRSFRDLYALIGAFLVLVIAGLNYGLLQRMVFKPLGRVCRTADHVSQGDLSMRLQAERNDEIGHLVEAMNQIGSGLTSVVSAVRHGAQSVATASAEIAHGNNDLSARTEQQASALEQTASSMEQLSAQVQHNAANARQANQMASSASNVAVQGGQVVGRVVETMKAINDSSHKIADIITVIDGIAFQTNILALNAAVEAARAGEQGRGFAVVASEVRSLAGRSAEAARDIKQLIEASVERVAQGTTLVDEAGKTMNEVVLSIKRVTDIMGEISAASNEQSQGVLQVGEAVGQMDQVTQQNAALVEQGAAAAEGLKEQAHQLVQAVALFKLYPDGQSQSGAPDHAGERVLTG